MTSTAYRKSEISVSPRFVTLSSFSCNDGLRKLIVPPVVAGGTITMV
jgi:hypothetical protein